MSTYDVTLFDTETTGLKPGYHEVIDIWARRFLVEIELNSAEVLTHFDYIVDAEDGGLVRPAYPSRVEPRAAAINGYTPQKWENAEPFPDVWRRVRPLLDGALWVGSSPQFDISFLHSGAMRWDCPLMPSTVQVVDVKNLAKFLLDRKAIKNRKLSTLAQYFGVGEQPHTAKGDVDILEMVYFPLVKMQPWRSR